MSFEAKRTLIFAILKFLRQELKQEGISPDFKESLEVASQCLESSYEIAIDDEICKNNFDAGIDLIGLAEKSVIKKEIAPELKEKADQHKTEGNELMKQEKFKEALDQYNKAIEIDKNNSVYYCNRAAAHSKLSDFASSIEDCKNALKIDPNYGKAWGRLGLALLSNNQIEEAYEAYTKAIQLEPTNDGYKQNLKIVEEKLKHMSFTAGAAAGVGADTSGFGNIGNMMSMFNNPQFMNMATQLMSDPQMQNVMSNLVSTMFNPNAQRGTSPGEGESTSAATSGSESTPPPLGAGLGPIFQSAQQWASQMNNMNPEFIQQMRERMNINPNAPTSSSTEENKDKKPDEESKK